MDGQEEIRVSAPKAELAFVINYANDIISFHAYQVGGNFSSSFLSPRMRMVEFSASTCGVVVLMEIVMLFIYI